MINFSKSTFNEDNFIEMSNIRPSESGLPVVIWIQPKSNREKHSARIKVERDYGFKAKGNTFSISIDKFNPKIVAGDQGKVSNKDLEIICDFIKVNFNSLINVWNDNISPAQFVNSIKKIL